MKSYRLQTLLRQLGACRWTRDLSGDEFATALTENRIATVHHGECDRDPFWAEPGRHGVNVVDHVIFPAPLPADCQNIVGVDRWLGAIPY